MRFKKHSDLAGQHAFLSASKYHWINYTDEKLDLAFNNAVMAHRGTQMHELAHMAIKLGVKMPDTKTTINMYVNDCIGFLMTPEQTLYVSPNCFGTADAIGFRNNLLRIYDLKTGLGRTSITQLEVYVAMFCLEYGFKPFDIDIDLRIYQSDECIEYEADKDKITHIYARIITADKILTARRLEAAL